MGPPEDTSQKPNWGWDKATEGAGRGTKSLGTPLAGRGTRINAEPTKREIAKEQAKEYGIDTRGLSTREINKLVQRASENEIDKDLKRFIEKTLDEFKSTKKSDLSENKKEIERRSSEEKRSSIGLSGATKGETGAGAGTPDGGGGNDPLDPEDPEDPEDPDGPNFPPPSWMEITLDVCYNNEHKEVTVLSKDPFYEPPPQ